MRLVLASASPRRLALLRTLGLEPEVHPPRVVEAGRPGESASDLVRRLARSKARSCAARLVPVGPAVILAADTAVVVDDSCLGKPCGPEDARRMLDLLSGRPHRVLTGMCALENDSGRLAVTVCETEVHFRRLSRDWIDWYVASGEPFDKAGGYGIQERGALFVDRITGSWTNVVGLPVEALPELFHEIGVELIDLLIRAG